MSGNSPIKLLNGLLLGMLLVLTVTGFAQTNVTPAQYLALQPKPRFNVGHRLHPLTKFSWPYSYELTVEMATNWGYALELGQADSESIRFLTNATKDITKLIALATNNPGKFKTSVTVWRDVASFTNPPAGYYCTNAAGLFVDATGTNFFSGSEFTKVVSPEAPAAYLASVAAYQASCIRTLQSIVPLSIIVNGGEYGLDVAANGYKAWKVDPRVQAATNGMAWPRYSSNQKARHIGYLTAEIFDAVPNRDLYLFYGTGYEQTRFHQAGYNWEDEFAIWGWNSDVMNTNVDLPSFENYYQGPNNFTNATGAKWSQVTDLLTRHLNGVAYNLSLGYSNSYTFVCGGWSNTSTNRLADIPRYLGLLKCLYTSGMVGGVAGYFDFPIAQTNSYLFGGPGFNAAFPTNQPPHWLQQIAALARVHAMFSHLDNFLLDGVLLSGPQKHFMSTDMPAYEFTNTVADASCRVLARKLGNQYLITAWAAYGPDRNVTVNLPGLGTVQVLARNCGSVYKATTSSLTLLDPDGLFPTEKPYIIPPGNLRSLPPP